MSSLKDYRNCFPFYQKFLNIYTKISLLFLPLHHRVKLKQLFDLQSHIVTSWSINLSFDDCDCFRSVYFIQKSAISHFTERQCIKISVCHENIFSPTLPSSERKIDENFSVLLGAWSTSTFRFYRCTTLRSRIPRTTVPRMKSAMVFARFRLSLLQRRFSPEFSFSHV